MDNNTRWADVVDHSWYVTERLNSLPGDNLNKVMAQKIAYSYNSSGADVTWAELNKQIANGLTRASEVELRFYESSLFPLKFAEYLPDTPVGLIRNALEKKYYAYEGFGLGGDNEVLNVADLSRIGHWVGWPGIYTAESSDTMIKLLSGKSARFSGEDDWYSFTFNEDKAKVFVLPPSSAASGDASVALDQVQVRATGNYTKVMLFDALRVSVRADYDPFLDMVKSPYRDFLGEFGKTLTDISNNLGEIGIAKVTRDSFKDTSGRVTGFKLDLVESGHYFDDKGDYNMDGRGLKVVNYVPKITLSDGSKSRAMEKLALLAWTFGRDFK